VQQGDIARIRATNKQLKREFESQKNVITEEVSAAYQQLLAARERLKYFQEQILNKSEDIARMARFAYQSGQSDITTVLAAQQSNVQAKALYLEAVRTYQQALTDLEISIGRPIY
ncbi:MAG: TolC family protein, partial [Candidatus Obscuribacterales bacterium]|nr:TolC family protein [Candidatus Obscuribacterales bacterium]